MKLEAVILAAGSGSRMVELTRNRPKCLLPVGNHCLIWFAITGLKQVGVNRIIILVPDLHETEIKQYCHKKFNSFKNLTLEFVAVPTRADCGTSESIISVKDKIRGDFIVYSCDSIVDPKALSYLVNHYRLYDPLLSMLLVEDSKHFSPKTAPGRREKEQNVKDIMIVEPLEKLDLTSSDNFKANRIILLQCEQDLKQKLRIRSKELALHPSLTVYSRFLDTHIYIFKRDVLNIMEAHQDRAVLKGEMIPLLISKQFAKLEVRGSSEIMEDEDMMKSRIQHNDYELELMDKLEEFNPKNLALSDYPSKSRIHAPHSCHSVIVKNFNAHRVNTLSSYLESNREAKSILSAFGDKKVSAIKDCVRGENTVIGEKCVIKKGSIGNNCTIGDKVKLIDCVLMDNVEIESNTSLSECIVGLNSKIGSKCDLKSCIVGFRQVVPGGMRANGEVIIDDGYVIDEMISY